MERENAVKEMTTHAQIYVEEYSATAAVIIIIMEVKLETEDMFGGSFIGQLMMQLDYRVERFMLFEALHKWSHGRRLRGDWRDGPP